MHVRWMALASFFVAGAIAACSASSDEYNPRPLSGTDGGAEGSVGPGDDGGVGPTVTPEAVSCKTSFTYTPPVGRIVHTVAVTGEWNGFDKTGVPLVGPAADGSFHADVEIPAGVVGYKLLLDGSYELDPAARMRKYVGGVENSGVRVPDCHVPKLALTTKALTRPATNQGRFTARVTYFDASDKRGLDASSVHATLRKDGQDSPLTVKSDGAHFDLDAGSLADGKYTILVEAKDKGGSAAEPLRLVFWVEPSTFDWHDAVIYMAMTDRLKDGDPSNNAAPHNGVDGRADFQGGDFQGVQKVIESGALDKLGVRALWLTPFQTNPQGPYAADDGVHQVMGYHGYWPTKAREVEPRLGGAPALHAMIQAAHAHGIRVLMDFVVNHVHKEHEYFAAHPDWFRTGCVCGTTNCDWTGHRLDCLFADYMPDVNWTVPAVSEQWGDDAVWWVDTFDLDGLRMDAVKHVEDAAVINLSARLRDAFEVAGNRLFLTGETAMGWDDCGLACNQSQYDTISAYVRPDKGAFAPGPGGLDGQFDFVLYHAVPYRAFLSDQKGMIHADYWAQASGWEYPADAIMTPYVGSHDTPRAATIATYRGQDAAHDPGIVGNKWDNYVTIAPDADAFSRQRLALAWEMGLPGAPLLYYGDEYGEWGGADPNNRAKWRGDGALSSDENATLALTRKLGAARRELVALRRGDYRPVASTETTLVFARTSGNDAALVVLNRGTAAATVSASLPTTIPLVSGTVLHDRLGGPDVTVTSGSIAVPLGARGAAILAP